MSCKDVTEARGSFGALDRQGVNGLTAFWFVILVAALGTAEQTPPFGSRERESMEELQRANEILALVNAQEPGWTFHRSMKSGTAAIGSDKRIAIGLFERAGAAQTSVWVEVHQLTSLSLAKRFVACQGPVGAGWSRQPYHLADESCLAEYTSGQYEKEMSFRLGTFGGHVLGRELPSVERIARILVDYIARSNTRLHPSAAVRDRVVLKELLGRRG